MENNKDKPVYPLPSQGIREDGLTKREYFIAAAMQGLCANRILASEREDWVARRTIEIADATLDKMDKK